MTRLLILVVALFAVFAPVPAMAATAPHVSATEQGIAIGGYDPVAFFTLGKPQPGMAAHSYAYQGATWRFATAENLAAFR